MPSVSEAVQYVEAGFAIFPVWGMIDGKCQCGDKACDRPGKHPITNRGVMDATTNVRQIRVWWGRHEGANIGLATGELSGVIVLDVDGPEGLQSLADKQMVSTPAVATGKGVHHYFRHPGFPVKNSVRTLGKGLDVRGDGGYVIAPPSVHASGNVYTWSEGFPAPESFATIPNWFREALSTKLNGFEGLEAEGGRVGSGGRNVYLTSKAGKMRRDGFSPSTIRAALISHNIERCEPPLPEDEVERIVQSIGEKPFDPKNDLSGISLQLTDDSLGDKAPTEVCRTAEHSEVGHAESFVSLYGDSFRYDHIRKKWMVWLEDSGVWREDFGGFAHRAMIRTIRARAAIASTITDDAERTSLKKVAHNAENGRGIENAINHAKTLPILAANTHEFDKNPKLLNFLNGTLDLGTMEFREPWRTDMISRQTAVAYDATAKAPLWEETISQIFNGNTDLISYFQRALGYSLFGRITEQAFFIAHGNGANGKSLVFNTIRKVLGDYGAVTAFATFDADSRNQYGNDLAALRGRRFVIAIEAEQSKRLAEARVKTITGGEPVSCRFLYGEFFEMIPEFKVWLAVNHKPIIRGSDHGIWRRIHLIPFEVTFGSPAEIDAGIAQFPIDRKLDQKLTPEYAGIVNWLVEGFQMWAKEGLNPPACVQAATKEYKWENDTVAQWLEDRCQTGQSLQMSSSAGYGDFRAYLTETGEVERAIPSMKVWGIAMGEKGFQKKRTSTGNVYLGVKHGQPTLNENRGN